MIVERGEWDIVEAFVGLPKSGKSTLMMRRACDYVGKCYVLAHDPNRNLPVVLPDGKKVPLVRHETIDSVRRAVAQGRPGIHASDADPAELLELAKEIARLGMVKKGHKEYGTPVLFLVDEIVVWDEECGTSYLGPSIKDLLARRRPHHVGFWFGTQFPTLCHKRLIALATKVHLFHMEDRADLKRMSDGGVPEKIVSQLSQLPKHRYLTYER